MKKTVKIFISIILIFIVWIGIDRYINITPYYTDKDTTMVQINDSIWVNIPSSKWYQIDNKIFKPLDSTQYVNHFNPILRTWKNVYGADYTYQFKNELGQPFTLQIFERSIDFDHEFVLDYELMQSETIDGVDVFYGTYNADSYAIQFKNEECRIIIIAAKYNLNLLKPTLVDILNQLQK